MELGGPSRLHWSLFFSLNFLIKGIQFPPMTQMVGIKKIDQKCNGCVTQMCIIIIIIFIFLVDFCLIETEQTIIPAPYKKGCYGK